jgi:uncharacterized protein YkwD
MSRRTIVPRVCFGLLVALTLAAATAVVPVGMSRAQDNGLASVTIYNSVCPPDYTGSDYYADCYGTPGSGYTFHLAGPGFAGSTTTAESGFTYFEGIDASGSYLLTQDMPADVVGYEVVCSEDGEFFPLTYVAGGVQLDLTTSDDLRCDWFNVPIGPNNNSLASITIYTAVCPTDYAGTAFFTDCFGTPGSGYTFSLSGPDGAAEATSGPAGIAFFEGLATAGSYTVTQLFPGDSVGRAIFCGEADEALDVTLVESGFVLDLTLDDDVRCDWYVVPFSTAPEPPADVTPTPESDATATPESDATATPEEPTPSSPADPTATAPVDPTATAPVDPTATAPAEPTATATATSPSEPSPASCPDGEELAMLALINDFRAQNGLGPLTMTSTLFEAAEFHSQDMASLDYFSHTLADGTPWAENLVNHGYTYDTARGENLAAGYADAQATFDQWVNSEPHLANLLDPNYTAIGIGRAENSGATYRWYWTANFGGYTDAPVAC